jgi:hypothetical protein
MKWNKCDGIIGLPETNGKDVELLLKVDNLPFQYLSVIWDGKFLFIYSGNIKSPWGGLRLEKEVKFKEWSYIE